MLAMARTTLYGAIGALALVAGAENGFALEAGNFSNALAGATVGLPLGASPPPGLYMSNMTFLKGPVGVGVGTSGCGANCITHYNAVADGFAVVWSSGWTFLGGNYMPSVVQAFYQAQVTSGPTGGIPAGGGVGASPINGWIMDQEIANTYFDPINFSWNLGRGFFVSAGVGFLAPDGLTYNGSVLPDYWTVRPHAAISYLGDGYDLTANLYFDINGPSAGRMGLYEIQHVLGAPLPTSPGVGYVSGNYGVLDWTATKKIGKFEVGPVGYFLVQTNADSPGSGWTCASLSKAGLPGCGMAKDIGIGLLAGYDFGPVNMQLIVTDQIYTADDSSSWKFFLRTSWRLWAPEAQADPPKKQLFYKN